MSRIEKCQGDVFGLLFTWHFIYSDNVSVLLTIRWHFLGKQTWAVFPPSSELSKWDRQCNASYYVELKILSSLILFHWFHPVILFLLGFRTSSRQLPAGLIKAKYSEGWKTSKSHERFFFSCSFCTSVQQPVIKIQQICGLVYLDYLKSNKTGPDVLLWVKSDLHSSHGCRAAGMKNKSRRNC